MLETFGAALPLVVDAGALELFATWIRQGNRRPSTGRPPAPFPTLLTPHAGEAARMCTQLGASTTRAQVEADPVGTARWLAGRTGATVLLKGAATLVVPHDQEAPLRVQTDAPAWLATAGAGDVLAGLAGTLLAAGCSAPDAGALAALVHGVAADRANPGGPVRALAVAHAIPEAIAHLLRR
ncbi:ADP/ATP-dependent (S)-NAD(P)H-hydrate dehydratase [Ornithinimicrobium pratense]|uniref:ADP-dependent NAD(P)H-hydrate dehydratase n=1 Tax=Ornithinimicrobium pratense TaxID=2593973 RepID=UPI00307D97A9